MSIKRNGKQNSVDSPNKLQRLLLIRPNMGAYRSKDALMPLALGILAALTPDHVEILFFDERVEEIPVDLSVDMVAISVETFTAKRAYAIADKYREKGTTVVMGGYHPTMMPDEALEHADAVVIGDAEGSWQRLIDDFEAGEMRTRYSGGNESTLNDYCIDRSLFSSKPYLPVNLVQFGRGCRYSCDFCSIQNFYHQTTRYRDIDGLVEEIKMLKKGRLIFFVDDNLFNDTETFKRLLVAIEPLHIRWACQISIDVSRDEDLLDRMAAAGCRFAIVGFESLIKENLIQMGKGWNRQSGDYAAVIERFHRRGISVYGTFVFGYDHDTIEGIAATVSFAEKSKMEIANFNPLTPTPGTRLYDRLLREGRLLSPQWWIDPEYHYGNPILIPKQMDPMAFAAACYDARRSFYSFGSIVRRILFSRLLWKPFVLSRVLMVNIISLFEIRSKQNRKLGER